MVSGSSLWWGPRRVAAMSSSLIMALKVSLQLAMIRSSSSISGSSIIILNG